MEGQYVAFERMMRDMMNETTMNMMMAVSYEAVEALAGVMNFYQGLCIRSTLQQLYNMFCYNTVLDVTWFKDGLQKCIDYIEK